MSGSGSPTLQTFANSHLSQRYSYFAYPSPHIYLHQLLPAQIYQQIKFPDIPVRGMGRSGRDLFVGEPGWAEATSSVGFQELNALFTSAEFVAWVLSVFEADLVRYHCRARADSVRLIPYLEDREALDSAPDVLDETADPSEVFTRFDYTIGGASYTSYAHLDSPRRIVGGVLFFSDAEKDQIDGGEFTLYQDLLFRDDRLPHWPHASKKIPVKDNTGVLFLNCNRAFHGPSAIRSMKGARKWIYYSISSRNRVWDRRPQTFLRAFATRATEKGLRVLGFHPEVPMEPKSKLDANALEK